VEWEEAPCAVSAIFPIGVSPNVNARKFPRGPAAVLPVAPDALHSRQIADIQSMSDKIEKRKLELLRILKDAGGPLGSRKLMENLTAMGRAVSERTIRHDLLELDKQGLTENLGKKGRTITGNGFSELENARVIEKVGFLSAKIDRMTYQMTFDLEKKTGTVITNVSILPFEQFRKSCRLLFQVYDAGYAMGTMMCLFGPGEKIGDIVVPKNMLGVGTVCSITLNGVLLACGIPTHSVFGGLLELRKKKPSRITEIIAYSGTSLDPLEVFIRSGMTDYLGATSTGDGRIGVGFREIPAESREHVIRLAEILKRVGLGGFLMIGWPGQPLLEIPVSEGRVGIVVIGGLNPAAILEESGIKIQSWALAGFVDYSRLFHYTEMNEQAARLAS
jgi:repressor of nif and glnA expression